LHRARNTATADLYHNGTDFGISNNQFGGLIFTTNSLEAGRFTNGRNFLVGTTIDGDSRVNIENNSSTYAAYLKANTLYAGLYRISRFFANSNIVMDITSDNGTNISFTNNQVGNIDFGTSGIVRNRLTSDGNFLIGSTTNTGNKLYLNGSLRIDGQLSGSAGASSGQHLTIVCDGTIYKIALLNN
jgi:hypothetical protein